MSLGFASLLPRGAAVVDGRLRLGGIDAEELVRDFGSPLFVYDAATLDERARAYAEPLADAPNGGRAVLALKALSSPAILRRLRSQGLGADAASAGEIAAAMRAGFRGEELVIHGNAKSREDMEAALSAQAGLIVLDSATEAEALDLRAREHGRVQDVLVRVTPGMAVDTHHKISTAHKGSKFGLEAEAAAALIGSLGPNLRFRGLHMHLGSQLLDPTPLSATAAWCADFCVTYGLTIDTLDLGGGVGVPYVPGDPLIDPRAYAEGVVASTASVFRAAGLAVPQLILEPGRSVVGPAGVTLHTVLAVKQTDDGTTWVALDHGYADNMRVTLYDARYAAAIATRIDAPADGSYNVCGRQCESGDILIEGAALPEPRVGDIVAVPVTGAYHQSLSAPYNLYGRPASVLVENGAVALITRRETIDDLLAREIL